MRKLSILLLLIGIPFMIIEANNLSTQRTKIIRWHKCQKTPNSIPIEANLNFSYLMHRIPYRP